MNFHKIRAKHDTESFHPKDKEEESDVVTIVYDLYDLGLWKVICIWTSCSMGDFKIFADGSVPSGDFGRNGDRRSAISGDSNFDCGGNRGVFHFKTPIKYKRNFKCNLKIYFTKEKII